MPLLRSAILGAALTVGSSVIALGQGQQLADDFSKICLETLPDISGAALAASELGYLSVEEGLNPAFDELIKSPPYWDVFVFAPSEQTLVMFKVAEKPLNNLEATVFGTDVASLCGFETNASSPDRFATDLSSILRMNGPSTDIMNSGQRSRGWTTLVDYQVSTILLEEFRGPTGPAYSVGLILPIIER